MIWRRRMYAHQLFVVVGIFRAFSSPFWRVFVELPHPVPELRLGTAGGGGYTLALMNEAIRPGPENPEQALARPASGQQASSQQGPTQRAATQQASGSLLLSVVVPTFNERDNVTKLFHKLEVTLAGV